MPVGADGRERRGMARVQLYGIFREALWICLLGVAIAVILYLPDQIREIYRIGIVESGWTAYMLMAVSATVMAVMVWFGAKLVATDSLQRLPNPCSQAVLAADVLPALVGVLPLLALAAGLYFALPIFEDQGRAIVGSVFENYDQRLETELGSLRSYAWITAGLVAVFLLAGYAGSRASTQAMAAVNNAYFRSWRFTAVSAGLIALITVALHIFPVQISTMLAVPGMLALFMICVVAMTVHLTLLSREYRWPLVSLPLALSVLFSAFNLNDNHEVRRLSLKSVPFTARPTAAPHADEQFHAWYERRPDLASYTGEYPVYIVAAQGGGIYAAYQTAIFLARMQDVCPAFKDHLFAISGVSGGSLGAAIFTAALREAQGRTTASAASETPPADESNHRPGGVAAAVAQPAVTGTSPCPAITAFLGPQSRPGSSDPGPVEREVRRMLSKDLLSPLIGATLFPDFTQRFLPWPFGDLDRARALEASFEAAASPTGWAGQGSLAESFLDHWNLDANRGPALLLNSADAATGRRVVIAPFAVRAAASEHRVGALAHFPFWKVTEQGVEIETPLDIRLSTAAAISARFPWLTPAATVTVTEAGTNKAQTIRLVDGGYVDNSGVETVLDLIHSLEPALRVIKDRAVGDGRTPTGAKYVPVKVALIALSGGGYPTRSSYALGETLEPIRALLSTRESRAYVALDRARIELGREVFQGKDATSTLTATSEPGHGASDLKNPAENRLVATVERLRISKLGSQYYRLPLGWALGSNTRDIIEKQSGRYWDCEFNERFEQVTPSAAQADCIQMLVFHELNQSLASEAALVLTTSRYRPSPQASFVPGKRLDNQGFLSCYRDTKLPGMTLLQARAVQAVLTTWDEHPEWTDDRWLAFMLGTLARESGGFRIKVENLRYSAQRLLAVFGQGRHSAAITPDEAEQLAGKEPQIAERIYGLGHPMRARALGNTQPGDGWKYRGRGMMQLTGRAAYREMGQRIGFDLEADPNLLFNPDISARLAIEFMVHRAQLAVHFNGEKDDWVAAYRRINGGITGIQDVRDHGKAILACMQKTRRS
jgi:predicted chitinase